MFTTELHNVIDVLATAVHCQYFAVLLWIKPAGTL